MRVASFDIVFQEIPGEVTLALNLSGCPCHCKGCHSPHLWEDTGEELTEELLDALIDQYKGLITCVAFMGGDQAPEEVFRLAEHVTKDQSVLRTAWYSGRPVLPASLIAEGGHTAERSYSANGLAGSSASGPFDYIKLGPYIEALGGLKSEKTNQRLYKRVGEGTLESPFKWEDITSCFWRNNLQ